MSLKYLNSNNDVKNNKVFPIQIKKLFCKLFVVSCILISLSCTNKLYLNKIDAYLNASSVESKAKYMADSYHSYFQEKNNDGDDKASSLSDFETWDAQLNPDVKILKYAAKGKTWRIQFNEQNDFSKLIGYPGMEGVHDYYFQFEGINK